MGKGQSKVLRKIASSGDEDVVQGLTELQTACSSASESEKLEWADIIKRLVDLFRSDSTSSSVFSSAAVTLSRLISNPYEPAFSAYKDALLRDLIPTALPFLFDLRDVQYSAISKCFTSVIGHPNLHEWIDVLTGFLRFSGSFRDALKFPDDQSQVPDFSTFPLLLDHCLTHNQDCVRDVLRRCFWFRFRSFSFSSLLFRPLFEYIITRSAQIWSTNSPADCSRLHIALYHMLSEMWMNYPFRSDADGDTERLFVLSAEAFSFSLPFMRSEKPVTDLLLLTIHRSTFLTFQLSLVKLLTRVVELSSLPPARLVMLLHSLTTIIIGQIDGLSILDSAPLTSNSRKFLCSIVSLWTYLIDTCASFMDGTSKDLLSMRVAVSLVLVGHDDFLQGVMTTLGHLAHTRSEKFISLLWREWQSVILWLLSLDSVTLLCRGLHPDLHQFFDEPPSSPNRLWNEAAFAWAAGIFSWKPFGLLDARAIVHDAIDHSNSVITGLLQMIGNRSGAFLELLVSNCSDGQVLNAFLSSVTDSAFEVKSPLILCLISVSLRDCCLKSVARTRDKTQLEERDRVIERLSGELGIQEEKLKRESSAANERQKQVNALTAELQELKDTFLCPICLDPYVGRRPCALSDCGHVYCFDCLNELLSQTYAHGRRSQCPLCKQAIAHRFVELRGM
jgi:hypothetical protein